jgi:predicted Zn-dependent peptidase
LKVGHTLVKQVVQKWIYPNGLTLIVDEAPQLMSVAIAAWVKTGTRHEDIDSAGLSHFLEHMVFKGGKKRGALDISKAVDRVGGGFQCIHQSRAYLFSLLSSGARAIPWCRVVKRNSLSPAVCS